MAVAAHTLRLAGLPALAPRSRRKGCGRRGSVPPPPPSPRLCLVQCCDRRPEEHLGELHEADKDLRSWSPSPLASSSPRASGVSTSQLVLLPAPVRSSTSPQSKRRTRHSLPAHSLALPAAGDRRARGRLPVAAGRSASGRQRLSCRIPYWLLTIDTRARRHRRSLVQKAVGTPATKHTCTSQVSATESSIHRLLLDARRQIRHQRARRSRALCLLLAAARSDAVATHGKHESREGACCWQAADESVMRKVSISTVV